MEKYFDHEKLDVYQAAIEFVVLVDKMIPTSPRDLLAQNCTKSMSQLA